MPTVPHRALFILFKLSEKKKTFLNSSGLRVTRSQRTCDFLKHVKLSVTYIKSEEPIIKTDHCTVSSWHRSAQVWGLGDIHADLTGTEKVTKKLETA